MSVFVYFIAALALCAAAAATTTTDTDPRKDLPKLARQFAERAAATSRENVDVDRLAHLFEKLLPPAVLNGNDVIMRQKPLPSKLADGTQPSHEAELAASVARTHPEIVILSGAGASKKHKRSAAARENGGNGSHRHCESAREVAQLGIEQFPDLSMLHPFVKLNLDEASGKLHFEVELPYIAFDARYVVSFEPIEHAQQTPLACSSNYRQRPPASYAEEWGHAPNANYHGAFSNEAQYGAYYNSPQSKWQASAAGCSHVVYTGAFTVGELLECRDTAEAFSFGTSVLGDKHRVGVVSGALHVSVLRPVDETELFGDEDAQDSTVAATWAHPFVVMVDEGESKVALIDSANGGLRRRIDHSRFAASDADGEDAGEDSWHENKLQRVETIVRQVGVDKSGRFEIELQTAVFDKPLIKGLHQQPRNMTLTRIVNHAHKSDFSLVEQIVDEAGREPYCVDSESGSHLLTLQNWRFVATERLSAYDGDFTLLFCDSLLLLASGADFVCDESTAMHRTSLSVRVSNPQSLHKTDIVFHSEITQHRDTRDDKRPHVGAFESGERVCMQTYVVGPKQLTQQMEVELVGAWLCSTGDAVPGGSDETALDCANREHSVQLVAETSVQSEALEANRKLNVTVHHPGLYGLLSVAVCFDADARFTDAQGRSIIETHQRYESHVRMQAATLRRDGALHVEPIFASVVQSANRTDVDAQHSRQYDLFVSEKLQHIESQSLQRHAFSQSSFESALRKLRADGMTFEQHAHHFEVTPREEDAHLVNESQASLALVIIVASIVSVFVAALCVIWRRSSAAERAVGRSMSRSECRVHGDSY